MLYLPSARRLILPSLVCLMVLTLVHLIIQQLAPSRQDLFRAAPWTHQFGTYIPSQQDDVFFDHNGHTYHSSHASSQRAEEQDGSTAFAPIHPRLANLLSCPSRIVNPITSHLRLPNPIRNISMIPPSSPSYDPTQRFFNPAIIPLPHWSGKTTYVLVTRLVTAGHHQESHICLADICHPPPTEKGQRLPPDARICTDDDITVLGPQGGMRCTTPPRKIDIPSTPAHACSRAWLAFPDIPGFHDPRVFWSGKGEPLILVNSASQYGCVGLWIIDLRPLFPDLAMLLKRDGRSALDASRPVTYESLTEITRNPHSSRSPVEKNWMLWFPNREDAYVQFDLLGGGGGGGGGGAGRDATHHSGDTSDESSNKSTARTVHDRPMRPVVGGRTFAKLIGNGYTTPNLTSPLEQACFDTDLSHDPAWKQPSSHPISSSTANHTHDSFGQIGHWHQGSNSLRLILCTRAEARRGECDDDDNNNDHHDSNHTNSNINGSRSVHFAVINRKFSNAMALPLRYERYIMVWEGTVPFRILGVSRWPLVWRDEWVRPWSFDENFLFRNAIQEHETETNVSMRSGSDRLKRRVLPVRVPQRNHSHSILTDGPGPEREQDQNLQHHRHNHHHHQQQQQQQQQQHPDILRNSDYAYFTYTPSLAWSWMPHSSGAAFEKGRQHQDQDQDQTRRKNLQHHNHHHHHRHEQQPRDHQDDHDDQTHDSQPNQFQAEDDALYLSRLGTGYLGDDVLVGVGLDDVNQGFVRVKVDDLVSCLRLCPGVRRV